MERAEVLEFKCPCCNAGLIFKGTTQKLTCEYCDNTFDIDTVRSYNESENRQTAQTLTWDRTEKPEWSAAEQETMQAFHCPACGGEILADETTAATFCPYCDNPTILPARLSGGLRPEAVIPFQTTKEDAKSAFLRLCKGKPLLPKLFTKEQRVERITGVYVPFWLYDCDAAFSGGYRATRLHTWADSQYHYTRTDHFLLRRDVKAAFSGIPMDGSSKMDDTLMESIEPYDLSQMKPFEMAYLSGFLADKYDVPSENGDGRVKQRVEQSIGDELQSSFLGYATVIPTNRQLSVKHGKANYVLMPVWLLNTNYRGKRYTFAMNGQTGKMTGTFPVCPKRTAVWFAGIFAGVTAVVTAIQMLL